eukprot:TRINITY_DN103142_c0_g1_i1.p1 TRINITY_DN103142_c0_g1~~TRINITY_DN103142_c0_g1_i1.p1  ORF type:complete len:296 (-),score=22.02 TRINITY_DN103142_c0_g1_i1:161-1048(-)
MAQSLVWDKLTPEDIEDLKNVEVADDVKAFLQKMFDDTKRGPSWLEPRDAPGWKKKNEILLDYYFHTLRFCREHSFTPEKTSAFFSIMHRTHTESMRARATHEESFKTFQSLIVQHSVHRPPFSTQTFTIADVKAINQYVTETYYRHYKMYLYAFTEQQQVKLTTTYGVDRVERPKPPPPLAQAIPEEEWLQQERERGKEMEGKELVEDPVVQVGEPVSAANVPDGESESGDQGLDQLPLDGSLQGLKGQLEFIRTQVSKMTAGKIDVLESKLAQLEAKLAESESKKDPRSKKKK